MAMIAGWSDLASLRLQGLRPALPVVVTDRWMLARNMADVGCITILHKRGEPMPVRWLDGLDVMLDFGQCELAGRIARLMRERDVKPKSMRAWCDCAHAFVVTCGRCDQGDEPWAA